MTRTNAETAGSNRFAAPCPLASQVVYTATFAAMATGAIVKLQEHLARLREDVDKGRAGLRGLRQELVGTSHESPDNGRGLTTHQTPRVGGQTPGRRQCASGRADKVGAGGDSAAGTPTEVRLAKKPKGKRVTERDARIADSDLDLRAMCAAKPGATVVYIKKPTQPDAKVFEGIPVWCWRVEQCLPAVRIVDV